MADSTKAIRTGDFLLYDIPQVCREAIIIINDTTTTVTRTAEQLIGYPVERTTTANTFRLCIATEESKSDGFIISGPELDLTSGECVSYEHVAITLPPCTVNRDKFPVHDYVDADFTEADLATAAFALHMRCVVEPAKTTTQSK